MNYQRIYDQLVERARFENRKKYQGIYYENHHIIPKSIGGLNNNNNLVLLTAREHFICHKLLVEVYPEDKRLRKSMLILMNFFKSNTSKEYEISRIKHSISVSIFMKENCPDRNGKNNPHYGHRASPELSQIFSDRNNNRVKLTCPYCGKTGEFGNMMKHHFDFCEQNPNKKERQIYECIYCGFRSKENGLINRWHNENCKHKPKS